MKIIQIIGGLGNQMFQYAIYLVLKEHFPKEKILTDSSLFNTYNVHNGLEIEKIFGVKLPQASFFNLIKVTFPTYNYNISRAIQKIFPHRKTEYFERGDINTKKDLFKDGNGYYIGYWQDIRYFEGYENIIKEKLKFKYPLNRRSIDLIGTLTEDSVSIHVRRGDYLNAPQYKGLCGIEYYMSAIKYVKSRIKNPKFYIFSDDLEWCKIHILPLIEHYNYFFVDWNRGEDSCLDMLLMSKCRCNIIANSSFSWWGAFLNSWQNKIVCAPKVWTNAKKTTKRQLSEWILF